MKDIQKTIKSRKAKFDVIIRDNRVYYLEEEALDEKPIEELFQPFGGTFVSFGITNEEKKDSFDEDAEVEE